MKNVFKYLFIGILLSTAWQVDAQIKREKSLDGSFAGKKELKVIHQHGPMDVQLASDGKVSYVANLKVEGKKEEDVQKMLEIFDVEVSDAGNRLELNTSMEIKSWNVNNGKHTIKLKDGTKLTGITDVKVDLKLKVPASLMDLNLSNKYDDITLGAAIDGKTTIYLFSGKLFSGDLNGPLELDMKYGKADVGDSKKSKLVLFDSELSAGKMEKVELFTKYSEISLGQINELTLEAFDDKINIASIKESMSINDKYSAITIGSCPRAVMQLFDSYLGIGKSDDLSISSKYTKFKLTNAGNVHFKESFDDTVESDEMDRLHAENSKYTDFKLGSLQHGFQLDQSFDETIEVKSLSAGFKQLHINGKYTRATVDIPNNVEYQIDAEMTYGKLEFPQDRMVEHKHIEVGEKLQIKGKTKGASDSSPKVYVRGFDSHVKL